MSGELKMPSRGGAALLLSELNAEHAPQKPTPEEVTNVTTLQETLEPMTVTSNEVTSEVANVEGNVAINERENAPANGPSKERTGVASNARRKVGTSQETVEFRPPDREGAQSAISEREKRLERGRAIAQNDEIAVVTIRVSAKLNKYLDDYVDRVNRIDSKRKYRKQDAIAEAFAAFYADHVMPPAPVEEEL